MIGHTLIFAEASKLDKVVLYSYDGENKNDFERKINMLKRMSRLEDIIIKKY